MTPAGAWYAEGGRKPRTTKFGLIDDGTSRASRRSTGVGWKAVLRRIGIPFPRGVSTRPGRPGLGCSLGEIMANGVPKGRKIDERRGIRHRMPRAENARFGERD